MDGRIHKRLYFLFVGARLCVFVYLCLHMCYFCDIRVSLCVCVYCAVGWLSAAVPAASRSTWIREALPTLKNGADLFENDTIRQRVCVILPSYPPQIARELCLTPVQEGIGSD